MRDASDILGILVDNITMQQAVNKMSGFLGEDKVHTIYTPNSEIIMEAQRDLELKSILQEADLLVADGAGVVLASKILNRKVPEKVSGIDLVKNSFGALAKSNTKYFFLGSKPGVAEIAAIKVVEEYPGIVIVGCNSGYFKIDELENLIDKINSSKAEILLVALGAPKQEKWIAEYKDKLNVKICMGVGGTLDVLAGHIKLAPEIFRKNGFEWLFRLYKEPRRLGRMMNIPLFLLKVIFTRLFK